MAVIAAAGAAGGFLLAALIAGRSRRAAMAAAAAACAALILALTQTPGAPWPRFDEAGALLALTAGVIAIASAALGRPGPILGAGAAVLAAGWPTAESAWALGAVLAMLAPAESRRRAGAVLAVSAGLAGLALDAGGVVVAGLVTAALLAGRDAGALGMMAAALAVSRLAPEITGVGAALAALIAVPAFALLDRRAGGAGAPVGLGLAGLLSGDPAAASAGWLMLAADATARTASALSVRATPFLRAATRAAAAAAPPSAGFAAGVTLLLAFTGTPALLFAAALGWGLSLALALRAPALRRPDWRAARHPAAGLLFLAAALAAFPLPPLTALLERAGP